MKRVLLIILVMAMVLSFAACGGMSVQQRMENVEKGMEVEEAKEILGEEYEEIVFEYKYAGETFIIYEQEDNKAVVVYTLDNEVDSVELVEDYKLWRENTDKLLEDDKAGIEISIDTFIERYNEIIKEYDYDFLLPIDKSDFEVLDDVDMLNVDYAYRYNYDDYKYTINYYTDDTDRVLNLMVTHLIDFDEDDEITARTHMDLFSIIVRSTIGIDATDVGLDEYETIGDYGYFNTYNSQFYIISIRHNDTYED